MLIIIKSNQQQKNLIHTIVKFQTNKKIFQYNKDKLRDLCLKICKSNNSKKINLLKLLKIMKNNKSNKLESN